MSGATVTELHPNRLADLVDAAARDARAEGLRGFVMMTVSEDGTTAVYRGIVDNQAHAKLHYEVIRTAHQMHAMADFYDSLTMAADDESP